VGSTVRLTIVEDEGAADALCGALRAEGIACGHRQTDVAAGGLYSFSGMREILVDADDLARARELIESVEPAVDECARCGRPIGEDGGWYVNDAGELEPYCALCAERLG
jgi:hypothetical protein